MEWIKAKYDRVLLGFCGVVALIIGAMLLMGALGWKKKFTSVPDAVERSPFPESEADKTVENALIRLKAPAMVKAPLTNGVIVPLFASLPVLKVAGDPDLINILDPKAKQVRPPVDNVWLFNNDLDLRQVNIAEEDTDGDKFSNKEEFAANPQTNPKDPASHPPVSSKIQYRELVQEPLSVRFNAFSDKPVEATFRVTTPTPETSYTTKFLPAGGKIQDAKGGQDRFLVTKIDLSVPNREFAILEDLKTKQKDIKAVIKEEVPFPTNRAKLVCTLGKEEEKIVSKGDKFTFEADPDQEYTVLDVTPEQVSLEYTPKGSSEKKPLNITILPPP